MVREALWERVQERLEEKVKMFADLEQRFADLEVRLPSFESVARSFLLDTLDVQWKDHLLAMDHLKEGIGLRGYGQRDPKMEYQREGFDLWHRLRIGVSEAMLGTSVEVPLIDDEPMTMEVPAGTQPGTTVRVPRRGLGRLNGRGRGDMMVEIAVDIPSKLTREEEDAVRLFAELRNERPADRRGRRRKR